MTDKPTISRTARVLRATGTLLGTATALGLAGTLVWMGSAQIAARAERLPAEAEITPLPVVTAPLVETASYEQRTRYPGRIEARRHLELGFEQGGTVADILFDEGDRVANGAVLARLDTRTLDANRAALVAARDALVAQAELATLTTDRQRALLDRNHVSKQRYDEARLALARIEAEIRATEAEIAGLDVALDKSVLRAPFNAVIGSRFADDGTRIAGGQPLFELFEDTAPQFRVGLPQALAGTLSDGDRATVTIEGSAYPARVARIRGDIDPATRTQAVLLALDEAADAPEGALGSLTLRRNIAERGAWVPTAALVEGVRGLWTVYLIDTSGEIPRARREAVELIHSDGPRAYVRGAFGNAAAIVAEGPHRVADDQPVALQTEG